MRNSILTISVLSISLILLISVPAESRQGCCSRHGGVCGCQCCDGTSLSAKCAPYYPGCSAPGIEKPKAKADEQGKCLSKCLLKNYSQKDCEDICSSK